MSKFFNQYGDVKAGVCYAHIFNELWRGSNGEEWLSALESRDRSIISIIKDIENFHPYRNPIEQRKLHGRFYKLAARLEKKGYRIQTVYGITPKSVELLQTVERGIALIRKAFRLSDKRLNGSGSLTIEILPFFDTMINPDGQKCAGFYDAKRQIIALSYGGGRERSLGVFLHEIGHHIDHLMGSKAHLFASDSPYFIRKMRLTKHFRALKTRYKRALAQGRISQDHVAYLSQPRELIADLFSEVLVKMSQRASRREIVLKPAKLTKINSDLIDCVTYLFSRIP